MDVEQFKRAYPEIDPSVIHGYFPRMSMDSYPELAGYSWEACHQGTMGPGGLFLASDMARTMGLEAGMRVLDLGPGKCASSIFLAKRYGVQVVAADHWINPTENWERIVKAGVAGSVLPIRMEAHSIPFAQGFFDAVFCMDAYHYFGTDDFYLSYLLKFVRPEGTVCTAGPCYAAELTGETPREFLHEESLAYHSPSWWGRHFEKTGLVDVKQAIEHPLGRELWLDHVRWELEERHPRERDDWSRACLLDNIGMLLLDEARYNTHYLLTATKKPAPTRSEQP